MCVCLAASVMLWAQQIAVKGVVLDEANEPIIGASVVETGTTNGTITDFDGAFALNVKANGAVQVSYVGYLTQTVQVNGQKNLKVVLKEDRQQLEEVVVVAFGKMKKEAFTGSAGVMKADELSKVQASNATQALAGRVAGVQLSNSSSQLGESPQILIRGVGSISSDTEPLIVVDGMPFDGDLNLLNANDIESMTVLKDAASNALYGARGANGVIMITTKRGTSSDATITVDAKWGGNSKGLPNYKTTNAQEFFETYYKMLYNTYITADGATEASAHALANKNLFDSGVGPGYVPYSIPTGQDFILPGGKMNPEVVQGSFHNFNGNTYWLQADDWEKIGLQTGFRQEYNVSASGRSEKVNVYTSLGYLDQEGIQEGSSQKRITARLKTDYQAKKWLKLGANMSFTNYNNSQTSEGTIGTGTIWSIIKTQAPIYPVFIRDANGNIMKDSYGRDVYDFANSQLGDLSRAGGTGGNAIFSNKYRSDSKKGNSFIASGYADITLMDGLVLTLNANAYDYDRRSTYTEDPYTDLYTSGSDNGYLSKSSSRTFTFNTQQLLNYNKTFGKHDVSALLGHEYYRYKYEYLDAGGHNFGIDGATELSQVLNLYSNPYSYMDRYNNEGYFFRGMYNYDTKYFGSVSFRRDASSRFATDHRWGNFWSVGGAWIISKEDFFDVSWVNELKFKASLGSQGNDNIGNYLYADQYTMVNNANAVAFQWKQKGSENITWETNTNFNVGVEFKLFNNRLTGSVDYFYRKTSDMLFALSTPPTVGYTSYYTNLGDMRNSGVELVLGADLIRTKDWNWTVDFNISHIKNKVLTLPEDVKVNTVEGYYGYVNDDPSFVSKYMYFVGEDLPLYSWYLPKYAGTDSETGESLFYMDTVDESGKVTGRTTTKNASDATKYLCGDAMPDFQGGIATSLTWRGFDFSVNATYQLGGKGYDYVYQTLMHSGGQTGTTWHVDMLNAWTPQNKSDIPALRYSNTYSQNPRSDRFLTSTSYISLQNVNFGYTLPAAFTKKFSVDKIRVYFAGENLCFLSARKGFDPRYNIGGYTNSELYSPIRTISGGVTLTF
ncbi:MAG: TonB-dependent receptor [Bacteroidales bacterium]|nr:TonB-dependent receptor [Bacteroidales bacterium]